MTIDHSPGAWVDDDSSWVLKFAGDDGDFALGINRRRSGVFDGIDAAQTRVHPVNPLRDPIGGNSFRRPNVALAICHHKIFAD